MSNRQSHEQIPEDPDQGSFFEVSQTSVASGLTDDSASHIQTEIIITPEGTYPDVPTAEIPPESDEVQESTVVVNAFTGKPGLGGRYKHSPLDRDGSYLKVRKGDVLPGGVIVYDEKDPKIQRYAAELEQKRLDGNG